MVKWFRGTVNRNKIISVDSFWVTEVEQVLEYPVWIFVITLMLCSQRARPGLVPLKWNNPEFFKSAKL